MQITTRKSTIIHFPDWTDVSAVVGGSWTATWLMLAICYVLHNKNIFWDLLNTLSIQLQSGIVSINLDFSNASCETCSCSLNPPSLSSSFVAGRHRQTDRRTDTHLCHTQQFHKIFSYLYSINIHPHTYIHDCINICMCVYLCITVFVFHVIHS